MEIEINGIKYPKHYIDKRQEKSYRQNIWRLYGITAQDKIAMNMIGTQFLFESKLYMYIGSPVYFNLRFLEKEFIPII